MKRFLVLFREAWRDWNYIFQREMYNIFHDGALLIFFILVPLAYPILYTLIYNNETLHETPIVVVDNSKSAMSRDYLRRLDGTSEVRIAGYAADMEEAEEWVRKRDAYGVVVIPATMADDIANMKQTHVSIFVDMGGLLYYKTMLLANTEVSLQMNREIKLMRTPGLSTRADEQAVTAPIRYEQVTLFNPSSGFAQFLIPAVMVILLHQTLLLGICLSAGTERESNKLYQLLPVHEHHHGLIRIITGKGAAYFVLYLWNVVFCLGIIPHVFHLPQLSDAIDVWAIAVPFLLACIFFGMTISGLIRHRENCMMIIVFSSLPLLFLSGISWPWDSIPRFWQLFAHIFPSTHGVRAFIKLNNMGASLAEAENELLWLWGQVVVYAVTTIFTYYRGLVKIRLRFPAHKTDSAVRQ
ncbi:MAG: ABC transporter permease [Alloprevotella sp.]|nr:ABC transporter permease [Alloprevotella sp.]